MSSKMCKCSNTLFEILDNECELCLLRLSEKREYMEWPYFYMKLDSSRIIQNPSSSKNLIKEPPQEKNVLLFDYLVKKGKFKLLEVFIENDCWRTETTIHTLFDLLFQYNDPSECGKKFFSKRIKFLSRAIISALKNEWYENDNELVLKKEESEKSDDIELRAPLILRLASNKHIFDTIRKNYYEKIVIELFNCGEDIGKDTIVIEKYLLENCKKKDNIPDVTRELFDLRNK